MVLTWTHRDTVLEKGQPSHITLRPVNVPCRANVPYLMLCYQLSGLAPAAAARNHRGASRAISDVVNLDIYSDVCSNIQFTQRSLDKSLKEGYSGGSSYVGALSLR